MKFTIRKFVNNWIVAYKKTQPYSIIPPFAWNFSTFDQARRFVWWKINNA